MGFGNEPILPIRIPIKFLTALNEEEARIILRPYPGLMILDASMLARVKELINDAQFTKEFDVLIVPKMQH